MKETTTEILTKVSSEFWLKYFNEYLYKNNLISHGEMLKINEMINRYINRI